MKNSSHLLYVCITLVAMKTRAAELKKKYALGAVCGIIISCSDSLQMMNPKNLERFRAWLNNDEITWLLQKFPMRHRSFYFGMFHGL